MNTLLLAAILGLAVIIVIIRRPHLWRDVKDEFTDAVREARADIERENGEKADPPGEPLTQAEAESIIQHYRSLARPALILRPDAGADATQASARLGGPAWLGDGEEWPVDPDGKRLEFIAQLDFARLPHLEGFPTSGVARFFVGTDDLWGANFDEPDRSTIRVLWHDGPMAGGRSEQAAPLDEEDYSPFQDVKVRANGLALRPEPVDDLPDYYSWQLQERIDQYAGRPGLDAVEDELMDINETRDFAHRIGGHPSFTQYDFRKRGEKDDFDILLLGLSSDDSIMWGDVGEAGFYIRPADLDRRDFSRVAFYWDCH